ncbi:hypothetical protein N431DRAFT_429512 [Stipitochalara longipes BDJ]|nr:hypothetical protein N431DRAFT_429512 [Stipitochalara longipes BDJ]
MPAFRLAPPRAKELHPSLLIQPKKPKPFWRRSLSLKSRKKSDTPSTDSGVADLSPPSPILHTYSPPEDEEIVVDINAIIETASPGVQELPRYTEGFNSPDVTVNYVEVQSFWSDDAYVTDDENVPQALYNDQVIQEKFGERMKERLQALLERNEFFAMLKEKREERKEKKRL